MLTITRRIAYKTCQSCKHCISQKFGEIKYAFCNIEDNDPDKFQIVPIGFLNKDGELSTKDGYNTDKEMPYINIPDICPFQLEHLVAEGRNCEGLFNYCDNS